MTLDELRDIIASRHGQDANTSYTAKLLAGGVDRIGKKIGEESAELILAAKGGVKKEVIHEAADLFYHALVLLESSGVPLTDIYAELDRRHRAPRAANGDAPPTGRPE